jgi:hypothetical protein
MINIKARSFTLSTLGGAPAICRPAPSQRARPQQAGGRVPERLLKLESFLAI